MFYEMIHGKMIEVLLHIIINEKLKSGRTGNISVTSSSLDMLTTRFPHL